MAHSVARTALLCAGTILGCSNHAAPRPAVVPEQAATIFPAPTKVPLRWRFLDFEECLSYFPSIAGSIRRMVRCEDSIRRGDECEPSKLTSCPQPFEAAFSFGAVDERFHFVGDTRRGVVAPLPKEE
jgi:hypothetical protein